ncbi:hypothetical protein BOX15_Mlig011821g4, partial [Macrostomum lignano]
VVGDLTPHCGVPPDEKLRREQAALNSMAANLSRESSAKLISLFAEYNAQATVEARLAKELDRLDMCCQAAYYQLTRPNCPNLSEFTRSCLSKTSISGVSSRIRSANVFVESAKSSETDSAEIPFKQLTLFSRYKEMRLMPLQLPSTASWQPEPVPLGCHQYMVCLIALTLPKHCLPMLADTGAAELVRTVGSANFYDDGSVAFSKLDLLDSDSLACPFDSANSVAKDASASGQLLSDLVWLDVALTARSAGASAAAATSGLPSRISLSYLRQVCEHVLH